MFETVEGRFLSNPALGLGSVWSRPGSSQIRPPSVPVQRSPGSSVFQPPCSVQLPEMIHLQQAQLELNIDGERGSSLALMPGSGTKEFVKGRKVLCRTKTITDYSRGTIIRELINGMFNVKLVLAH